MAGAGCVVVTLVDEAVAGATVGVGTVGAGAGRDDVVVGATATTAAGWGAGVVGVEA
jgi:hypothetical protein